MHSFSTHFWRKLLPQGLPASRSLMCDLLYFHGNMPTVSQKRKFSLRQLQDVRQQSRINVKWSLLFLKAYALMAREFPSLRQTYMSYPWPHLHEHDCSIANMAITREHEGDEWLFFAPFPQPENMSLRELQSRLDRFKTEPVEQVFKSQYRLAKMPWWARRVFWWLRFNYSARKRVKRLGTFGLTTVASQGVTIIDPRAPLTSLLTYGPLDQHGQCEVTIAYDHRVLDGSQVARALCRLEEIMRNAIVEELEQLQPRTVNRVFGDEVLAY